MANNNESDNHFKLYKLLSDTLQSYHFRWINNYRIFLSFNSILLPATIAVLGYSITNGKAEFYIYVFILAAIGLIANLSGLGLMNRIHIDTAIRFAQLRKIEDEIKDLPIKPFTEGYEFFFNKKDITDKQENLFFSQNKNKWNCRAINAYRCISGSTALVFFFLMGFYLNYLLKKVFGIMDITTYRYLMSALIQVFGTLIAVEGIFIIFKKDQLYKDKDIKLFELGKIISAIYDHKNDLHLISLSFEDSVIAKAKDFHLLSADAIDGRIIAAEKFLENISYKIEKDSSNGQHQSRQQNIADWRFYFKETVEEYKSNIKNTKNVAKSTIKMMGTPAFLCILFSFGLLIADILGGFYFRLAMFFIILSLIGLVTLIYWAKQILSE